METNHLFTTGAFAKASNTTKQTLFHYDEIGLLPPHFKDEKGYRYYSHQQFDVLFVIDILKELGMSLKEIKQFIETNTPEQMMKQFRGKSNELSQKIERLNQIQKFIQTKIEITGRALHTDFSQIQTQFLDKEYLFLSDCIVDHSDYAFVHAVSTFIEQSNEKKLNIGHPIGAMLHKDKIVANKYANYSFLYIKSEETRHDIHAHEKPSGLYVIGYHMGDYPTLPKTYDRLLHYMEENQLQMKNFAYEEYVLDSVSVRHIDAYVTKISIPVESRK